MWSGFYILLISYAHRMECRCKPTSFEVGFSFSTNFCAHLLTSFQEIYKSLKMLWALVPVFYSPPHIPMDSSWTPHGLCITCPKVLIIPSKSCAVHEDSTQNYRVHQFGVDYDKIGVKSTLVGVISHCLLYIIPSNTFYILQSYILTNLYHTYMVAHI